MGDCNFDGDGHACQRGDARNIEARTDDSELQLLSGMLD
jgi:hypothetical protein